MNYNEAVEYISSLLRFGIRFGTERFTDLLCRIDNPQHSFRSVHIGGTNGKGSTTAVIASILQQAGFNVGGYFSPYVFDLRERIQYNSEMISRDDFARIVTAIKPILDEIKKTPFGETTEFEMKTAAAFTYFAEKKVDFAAIEVGMGGRLDATNVIMPLVSVITNVGLDHTERLGTTYSAIAAEKAGIIKPNTPIITAAGNAEALEVIKQTAFNRNAPLTIIKEGNERQEKNAVYWNAVNGEETNILLPDRTINATHKNLPGRFQSVNTACAAAAIDRLTKIHGIAISDNHIKLGIENAWLPGRYQIIRREPSVILDGAHNPDAANALADTLKRRIKSGKLILILGMTQFHNAEQVLQTLCPLADKVILTQPNWVRSLPVDELFVTATKLGISVQKADTVQSAVEIALNLLTKEDTLLITGSFYTIGDINPDWFKF